ncbi:hypothetical protein JFU04_00895 [Pseudomonas sp. TH21]|uniref:hypothetical protein n=1 Tax=Pseudomonas sp. TH21 TaxID=2796387 RepID=UPI00191370EF|nr:hypothetical protein [Pseudomonas sp. TH21]MBK5474657.1 hypothetical protein [Pseudomonas sp. TH21]
MINFDKKLTAAIMLALPMIGASYNAHATTVTFNTPTAGYNGPQYIGGPNQGDRINEIFTVPKGVTKMTVTVTGAGGGGGGGGGAYSIGVINSRASGGGGGGGGATVKCTFEPVKVERFYFGVADGGKEGPGGALEKNGDSGKGGQGDAYVYFFNDKGDGGDWTLK